MNEKKICGPLKHGLRPSFRRADLEIYGIDTFCPSYVGRIFLNDPVVDESNCSEERETYAGLFAVFGHAQCVGDQGHCDVPTSRRRFDDRPSHPLTPAFRRVVITDALRRAMDSSEEITITIIASASIDEADLEQESFLNLGGLQIVTFD